MRLLVTGGAGYIGGTTVRLLVRAGHTVTVLDDLSTGHLDALPVGVDLVRGDVGDVAVLDDAFGRGPIDAVLHFAGLIAAGESMREPARYLDANVGKTLALLEAMGRHGVRAMVFSSSAGVYGEPHFSPMTETHPTVPTSVYGLSKLLVEQAMAAIADQGCLRYVALRYFNAAGSDGVHGEHHPDETHLIPLALRASMGRGPALKVFGTDYPTDDGTCVRDYVHVVDLAAAHVAALDALESGTTALVCNLGTGRGYSVREVLDAVEAVTGSPVPFEEAPRRPGDPAELVAGAELASIVLGWTPARSSLAELLADAWAEECRDLEA